MKAHKDPTWPKERPAAKEPPAPAEGQPSAPAVEETTPGTFDVSEFAATSILAEAVEDKYTVPVHTYREIKWLFENVAISEAFFNAWVAHTLDVPKTDQEQSKAKRIKAALQKRAQFEAEKPGNKPKKLKPTPNFVDYYWRELTQDTAKKVWSAFL